MTPITCLLRPTARAAAHLVGVLLAGAELDIHPGQEQLLQALWADGPQSQTQLACGLGLDPSTVTKSLQRLERAGLIERGPAAKDRRVTVVTCTGAGEDLRHTVQAQIAEADRLALEGFTEDERVALKTMLERIQTNMLRAACPTAAHAPTGLPAC